MRFVKQWLCAMLCTVALGNANGTSPAKSWMNNEYQLKIMWAAAARSGVAPGLMRNLRQQVPPPPHMPPPAAAAAAAPPALLPLADVPPPGLPGAAVGPAAAAPGVPQPLPGVAVGPDAASSFRGSRWNHNPAPTPRPTDIENRLADIESRLADIESSLVARVAAQVSGGTRHLLARVEALEMLARPGGAPVLVTEAATEQEQAPGTEQAQSLGTAASPAATEEQPEQGPRSCAQSISTERSQPDSAWAWEVPNPIINSEPAAEPAVDRRQPQEF